nr:MAG TPA: hypothetical protein [Bacteriophage sp.]
MKTCGTLTIMKAQDGENILKRIGLWKKLSTTSVLTNILTNYKLYKRGLTKASPFFLFHKQPDHLHSIYVFVLFLSIYPEICVLSRLRGKHVKLSRKTI